MRSGTSRAATSFAAGFACIASGSRPGASSGSGLDRLVGRRGALTQARNPAIPVLLADRCGCLEPTLSQPPAQALVSGQLLDRRGETGRAFAGVGQEAVLAVAQVLAGATPPARHDTSPH